MSAATKKIKPEKSIGLVNQDADKKLEINGPKIDSSISNINKGNGILQGYIKNGEGDGQGVDHQFASSGISDDYQKLLHDGK